MPLMTDAVRTELSEQMCSFVRRQEMMFVATGVGGDERACTFVAGGAGFVRILDVNRLAWPEFLDSGSLTDAERIAEDPAISLVFVDLARGAVELHIEGYAKVLDDDAMRRAYRQLNDDLVLELVAERRPDRWVTVWIEEAYLARP